LIDLIKKINESEKNKTCERSVRKKMRFTLASEGVIQLLEMN